MGDQQLAGTIEVRIPDETLETPELAPELTLELARLAAIYVANHRSKSPLRSSGDSLKGALLSQALRFARPPCNDLHPFGTYRSQVQILSPRPLFPQCLATMPGPRLLAVQCRPSPAQRQVGAATASTERRAA